MSLNNFNLVSKVFELADLEKEYANNQYGELKNCHEGHGVLLEEMQEVCDAYEKYKKSSKSIQAYWRNIRRDNHFGSGLFNTSSDQILVDIIDPALGLACEAIQVVAMCLKNKDLLKKMTESKTNELQ